MSQPIQCICNKKEGGHRHMTWGGLPHEHWNPEVRFPRRRACSLLHWYCHVPDCACGGNPNASNTMKLVNKVISESRPRAVAA